MIKHLNYINFLELDDSIKNKTEYKSKMFGNFIILSYRNARNVSVKFTDTGYSCEVELVEIRRGMVKDRHAPSVWGVGFIGTKYQTKVEGVLLKEYRTWIDMLKRCYDDNYKRKRPTYKHCEVSGEFKSYEYFYEWCNKQIGFGVKGFELDKDLLVKGNKLYSKDMCVFLPHEINSALVKCDKSRGNNLIGVYFDSKSNKYSASIGGINGSKRLGTFKTEIEAFNAYKQAKEIRVKEIAEKWKDKIGIRAYNALMNYQVEITD